MAEAPRRRGRPVGDEAGEARGRIVDAASSEFADKGYDAASIRGIARRAGVDARLVHHYFADKAALLVEAVRIPARPDRVIRAVAAGPLDELGPAIARAALELWEQPAVRPAAVALLRSAVGTAAGGRIVREFIARELIGAIATRLGGDDEARLRAGLVASQMAGVLMLRHVVRMEPIASASLDELVERIGPVLQLHLTGPIVDKSSEQAFNSSHGE